MDFIQRKKLAAIAGVARYLKAEAEAAAFVPAPEYPAKPEPAALSAPPAVNSWGASGRQAQMQIRGLMQIKAFHRIR